MGVDYSKIRSISAKEIISALIQDGFYLDRQKSSHQHYYHPDGRHVTIAFHGRGEDFKRKTLKSMFEKQACWTEDDLKRLSLLKQ
jgi:predicted RNA binding protein YcfA (HicA-like mRNA interferase family)